MDVGRTDGVGGPGRIDGPQKISRPASVSASKASSPADKVDISAPAGLISKALALPEVRTDRVAEVKKLIESGKFDTQARLEGALDRFLAEEGSAAE
mgnify:CR=1 FL=1